MRRKLAVALLGLMMVFGFSTSNFALAAGTNGSGEGPASTYSSPADTTPNLSGSSPTYPGSANYVAPTTTGDVNSGTLQTGDTKDNNISNANQTGTGVSDNTGNSVNTVVKAVYGQKTHGEYSTNTNSCASCHQTHTAASKSLLFKDGVYSTCTACHDGTLGFYNVYDKSTAGTFGGTHDGNSSVHLSTGVMQVKAAPGGNTTAATGSWTNEFNCASCHAPHGSYSDRLLNYNPNNMANTTADQGGQKLTNLSPQTALPAANAISPDSVLYSTTSDQAGITAETAGTPVLVLMQKVQDSKTQAYSYQRDTTPWLYGYDYNEQTHAKTYYTQLRDNTGAQLNGKVLINYGQGYAKAGSNPVTDVASADIARVYVTKLSSATKPLIPVTNANGYTVTKVDETVYTDAGIGVQIGKYCAACHTDYRAKSGAPSGTWSKAFRHTTNTDSFTCLKCHYAHGTDVTVMKDSQDQTVDSLVAAGKYATVADAKAYMLDKNPSSALKRYTNMSICWKCHGDSTKSSQLINNGFNTSNNSNGGTNVR